MNEIKTMDELRQLNMVYLHSETGLGLVSGYYTVYPSSGFVKRVAPQCGENVDTVFTFDYIFDNPDIKIYRSKPYKEG